MQIGTDGNARTDGTDERATLPDNKLTLVATRVGKARIYFHPSRSVVTICRAAFVVTLAGEVLLLALTSRRDGLRRLVVEARRNRLVL